MNSFTFKRISFNYPKNRKMDEETFRDYAASIQYVTGRKVEVVSNDNTSTKALDLILSGKKIGGWSYCPVIKQGRGHYYLAA